MLRLLNKFLVSGFWFLVVCLPATSYQQPATSNGLEFIENRGQVVDMEGNLRPDILFIGDGGGAKIYLRQKGVSYVSSKFQVSSSKLEEHEEEENELETWNMELGTIQVHRVDMEFVNANINASVRVEKPTQGYFNYYLGHCPEGITGVKAHRKVIYENMYPNIDVMFYSPLKKGVRGLLEYDFVVKPGGSVEDIILKYKGAESITVIASGSEAIPSMKERDCFGLRPRNDTSLIKEGKLHIKTSLGEIKEEIPEVYQIINGERIAIEAAYVLKGNEVSMKVGNYDKSKELIIDPWVTYYGGSGGDGDYGIATDNSGNVLITGRTSSADFPVTPGAFQSNHALGFNDAFVVKLEPTGNQLWATWYGGGGSDVGRGIATDDSGNVLITGSTASTDFPFTPGAFQTTFAGGNDAFVVKFNAAGNRLWATFYGGDSIDVGYDIATDGSDNVLITGWTKSTDFPVTTGAFQTSNAGGNDAFVVKLDGNDGYPLWATYYGGSGDENFFVGFFGGGGIATDGSDNVLISGETTSTDFPFTPGAFQTSFAGGTFGGDAFVVKLDSAGSQLWATYYGGSSNDFGFGIATDGSSNVLITGWTKSINFPVTTGAFQTSNAGGYDAFVVKLEPTGDTLWATYLGGSSPEEGLGIAVDGSDNIFVAGDTYSIDFPFTPGAFQTNFGGVEDNYMVKFDQNGNQKCGTYLGGSEHDEMATGGNIAVYGGLVYMTGATPGNYPITPGSFQTAYGGGTYDIFIAQFCDDCTLNCSLPLFVNASAFPNICKDSCTNLSASAAFGTGSYNFSWTSIPPGFTSAIQNPGIVCPDITITYIVTVDDGDTTATASVTVSVEDCDTTENIFFIPNSFSPNDDKENDILLVRGSGIKNIKLFIYNRWGEKVFETYDINNGWDGTYRKKPLNTGVFAWYAEVEFEDANNPGNPGQIYRKGNVTLIK